MALARRLFLVPFDLTDRAIAWIRRQVRGYPSPDDFRRMGPSKTLAYMQKIGFDRDLDRALTNHRARKAAADQHEAPGN